MDPYSNSQGGKSNKRQRGLDEKHFDVLSYFSSMPDSPSLRLHLTDKVLSGGVGRSEKPSG